VAEPSARNAGQRPCPPAGTGVRQQPGRGVAAAERRARQIGVSMFIAVVNDCSVIKMSSRMDGNRQASVTVVRPRL
jgi:hypothetical protein